jgi:2-polyprenyl-3-methyl-5-hydroxy-6-metoxy-1,4-benzoquinol methylase
MLSSHLKLGMTVLELGCGTGYFTRELARSGADIVAIDVSPELLEIASANCSVPNVRYEIQNAYELSYPDAVFDSVVGSSVLHHLEIDPFDFLRPKTPVPLVNRLNSVGPIPRKRGGDLAVCRLVLYPSS